MAFIIFFFFEKVWKSWKNWNYRHKIFVTMYSIPSYRVFGRNCKKWQNNPPANSDDLLRCPQTIFHYNGRTMENDSLVPKWLLVPHGILQVSQNLSAQYQKFWISMKASLGVRSPCSIEKERIDRQMPCPSSNPN